MTASRVPLSVARQSRFQIAKAVTHCCALTLVLVLPALPYCAAAANIWLGGEDPVVQKDKHKDNPADYMDMFTSGAPWPTAASSLTVFTVSMQFVLRADKAQLQTVIDDLKRRRIALGVDVGVLDGPGAGGCGYGVEGYASPASVEAVARRVKNLGGAIDYLAMDEPVWYGHVFERGGGAEVGCRYTVADIAEKVALKVGLLRQYFPSIQIGDVEPVNARLGGLRSIDDTIAFVDLLRRRTGVAPAFVHADIAWPFRGWQFLLEDMAARLRARGVHLGVICDGDANAGGDAQWVSQALERCRSIAADPRINPDDFIVQSWEPLPTKMLPETDRGTLTYAVTHVATLVNPADSVESMD